MSKLQVDDIVNKDDTGSVGFSRGAVVTGVVTATGGSFSGNVSVGGTLTYEDVTNIDSVGIVTARTGVRVTAGGLVVTAGIATLGAGLTMGDNDRAYFGDAGDLQIYHDGSNSFIKDVGTGILQLNTNYFQVKNAADDEFIIQASQNGAVSLRFDNSEKFATTTAGVVVTGIVTATEGLVLDGQNGTGKGLRLDLAGSDDYIIQETSTSDVVQFGGTGSANFFVHNISSGRVGINTATPTSTLDVEGTISDSIGPLRRLGITNHDASTLTLDTSHAGNLIREATNAANITVPQNVFTAGDMITIFNVSSGDNTITQGTGVTLYNTADAATGNRTLAAKGVCTIACTSSNEFIISGSNLS